jgi:sterol 3beta-glucosyltransferase
VSKGPARNRSTPGLESFVAGRAPPVYVGFGSSVGPDPARAGAAVSGAVRQADIRAMIASG